MNLERLKKNCRLVDPDAREFIISAISEGIHQQVSAHIEICEDHQEWIADLYFLAVYCLTDPINEDLTKRGGFKDANAVSQRVKRTLKILWERHPDYQEETFHIDIKRRRKKPLPGTHLRQVYDLHFQGKTFDQIGQTMGISTRELTKIVTNIRRLFDEGFMSNELIHEVKKDNRKSLKHILSEEKDHSVLEEAFKKVNSTFLTHDREKKDEKVLFSLRELASSSGYEYHGAMREYIVKVLRSKGIFIGVYLNKVSQDSPTVQPIHFIPRVFKEEAVKILEKTAPSPRKFAMKYKVYYLGKKGCTPDEIAHRLGITYETVVAHVLLLRKEMDEVFLKGKLRYEVKEATWRNLDSILANCENPLLLKIAFKKISSSYVKKSKEKEIKLMYTIKELSELTNCHFNPTEAHKIIDFLRLNGIYVGMYEQKKRKGSTQANRTFYVPLVFMNKAITLLKQSKFVNV